MQCDNLCIHMPNNKCVLRPGSRVKLGRFESILWSVQYGWYSYAGNREVCGWYLICMGDTSIVKPLFRTDLYDIYLIESH